MTKPAGPVPLLKPTPPSTPAQNGQSRGEVTADTVLASACLPFISQAVEIDGEAYWDGGYMGNPAIFPLIYNCECADVIVV
ncbi:MAG TPA: patatin-like phospholipase family protein, partial [Gemmatimonadales bacterium]|nr:patatin-like phospholipase family protein [Gemmatimonadales bacterium]